MANEVSSDPSTGESTAASAHTECSEQLLERWRARGEPAAGRRLAARYEPRLRRLVDAKLPLDVRQRFETQELVQEIFARALSAAPTFEDRGAGSLWAWMRGISRHVLHATWRANARLKEPQLDLDDSRAHPPDRAESALARLERDENGRLALAAIARLEKRDRQAVLLRLELGLSFKAIARALGFASEDAARMATQRALARVARELGGDDRSA